jgi:hypothetical protein
MLSFTLVVSVLLHVGGDKCPVWLLNSISHNPHKIGGIRPVLGLKQLGRPIHTWQVQLPFVRSYDHFFVFLLLVHGKPLDTADCIWLQAWRNRDPVSSSRDGAETTVPAVPHSPMGFEDTEDCLALFSGKWAKSTSSFQVHF